MATHASALVGEETVKLLRVDQVAEMLAVSETTVRTFAPTFIHVIQWARPQSEPEQ